MTIISINGKSAHHVHRHEAQQQQQPQQQQLQHLPRSCERIAQGVAKLSAFRIPPAHLKRCSEGSLPFTQHLMNVNPQPKIIVNGVPNGNAIDEAHQQTGGKTHHHRPAAQRLSSSSNCLLRVGGPHMNGAMATNGRRLLSLDSCAPIMMAGGRRMDWLSTQQMLVSEAAELRRQRKKSWWNGVGASYAFLALSVLLSLSVVIGVCLFLHSFVPKEYSQYNRISNAGGSASGRGKMSRANRRMDPGLMVLEKPKSVMEIRTFEEPIPEQPDLATLFYRRRRK